MSSIESNICQAVDIIVKKALSQAEYDRTILAQIISCIDATIGKYKVKYQDSVFYAYSNNVDTTYSKGTDVYILVPNGDLNKEKTIIGTTKKLGINYINIIEGDDAYEYLGTNCIEDGAEFTLCSYKPETRILYNVNNPQENKINLNINNIEEYIKGSSTLICGAHFRTQLENEQRYQGNYGIIFGLDFQNNATFETETRYYVIDVNQMTGNPYKFSKETRQYGIFNIDGDNFQRINSISIFTSNFPKENANKPNDIFINNLELYAAARIQDAELNTINLSFITLKGTYFPKDAADDSELSLEAQIKVKGKLLNNASQNIQYYWFVEHNGVTAKSKDYNKYGGLGWKCLNRFTEINDDNGETLTVEWIPGSHQFFVKKRDLLAKEVKYKCVAIYNNNAIERTILLKNPGSNYNISIESDSGTKFYYDVGHPTLTCVVTKDTNVSEEYRYVWSKQDSTGYYEELKESSGSGEYENAAYKAKIDEKNQILAEINESNITTAEQQKTLDNINAYLTKAKNYCRIELNKIHNLQIKTITDVCTYKCSVYATLKSNNGTENEEKYVGTASITITNSMHSEGVYSLVINDGTQVFKYDENGIGPTSPSAEKRRVIKALSFTIYDNFGKPIDDNVAKHSQVQWKVPIDDTMLKVSIEPNEVDSAGGFNVYYGKNNESMMTFAYDIASSYNISKTRNNIQLVVRYKDMNLTASTNFTFTKDGEPGTNGTDFICRIVPNFKNENVSNIVPTLVNGVLNYTSKVTNQWFRAQLWENNGEQAIFDGVDATVTDNEKGIQEVNWSVLQNKYTTEKDRQDPSHITIEKENGVTTFKSATSYDLKTEDGETIHSGHPADIIKVEIKYNDKIYCATYPVPYIELKDSNLKLEIKPDTGFKFAIFSSDGQSPKYDTSYPFEIIVKNNEGTDVSLSKQDGKAIYTYKYKVLGNVCFGKVPEGKTEPVWTWTESNNLKYYENENTNEDNKVDVNYALVKPKAPYDGFCVNNALECIVYENNDIVGRIHIPIHLMLNRYGLSALNDWDGNSVKINSNEGYILSPQIGAGYKDSTNAFTGIIMGKVENSIGSKTGVLGYVKGQQSLFLDAESGKAEFGVSDGSKIIIEPGTYTDDGTPDFKAEIRSGNYSDSGSNKGGMLIDFAQPLIKFGTGNFIVDANGCITAKGGGSIAGWSIDNYKIYKNNTGMSSVDNISATGVTKKTIKLPTADEESKDVTKALAFWAGNEKFMVSHDGYLTAKEASIGSGSSAIFIGRGYNATSQKFDGKSAIFSGKKNNLDADATGFYLGTDGISIGGKNTEGNPKFKVTNQGYLTARDGEIGGWTIKNNSLKAGNIVISGSGSIKHQNGDASNWGVNSSGSAYFKNVEITGSNSSAFFGNGFSADTNFALQNGALTAFNNLVVKNITADNIYATHADIKELYFNGSKVSIQTPSYMTDMDMTYEYETPYITIPAGTFVTSVGGDGMVERNKETTYYAQDTFAKKVAFKRTKQSCSVLATGKSNTDSQWTWADNYAD